MKSLCYHVLIMVFFGLGFVSCGLTANQEKKLNHQTGLYLGALKARSVLTTVSLTHPDYVQYAHDRGADYFKNSFAFREEETDPMFIDLQMGEVASSGNQIQVLFTVRKEYIYAGENANKEFRFVALSEDYGKNWFFLREGIYRNRNICKKINRLLNI